jgi:hypothetical protein
LARRGRSLAWFRPERQAGSGREAFGVVRQGAYRQDRAGEDLTGGEWQRRSRQAWRLNGMEGLVGEGNGGDRTLMAGSDAMGEAANGI